MRSRTAHSPSEASARPSPRVSIKSPKLNAPHTWQILDMVNLIGDCSKVRLLPAPEIPIMSDQPITVEMEFTPGVLRVLRRHGFLEGETPDLIIAAVFGMLAEPTAPP